MVQLPTQGQLFIPEGKTKKAIDASCEQLYSIFVCFMEGQQLAVMHKIATSEQEATKD